MRYVRVQILITTLHLLRICLSFKLALMKIYKVANLVLLILPNIWVSIIHAMNVPDFMENSKKFIEVDLRDSISRSMTLYCIGNIVKFADRGNNYRNYGEEREVCYRRAGFPYVTGGRRCVCR